MITDPEFARERLTSYLALWDEYKDYEAERDLQTIGEDIISAQPTVMTLLHALGEQVSRIGLEDWAQREHRRAVLRALGILADQGKLERALAPRGPELRAAGLHPWVWEAAAPYWPGGHYRSAVATAAGSVSLRVQSKLDRWDVADDALMTESLSPSPAAPGRPRLRLPITPGRPFEEALQSGALAFARGVYALLRNPATHNVTEEWGEQRALESLAALSLLARVLDDASIEQVEQ
ncbi:TIGR02391 family protein [Modestobacter sp. SYSU DS0290]